MTDPELRILKINNKDQDISYIETLFYYVLFTPLRTMTIKTETALKTGFDNEAYIKEQTASILERVKHFHEKPKDGKRKKCIELLEI